MDQDLAFIFNALETRNCLVLTDFVNFDHPGNSEVYTLSIPIPIPLLQAMIPHFAMLAGKQRSLTFSDFKLGLNVVKIDGSEMATEGLHVHLSHIIAIVFEGEGTLEWESSKGERYTVTAKKSDCVIIPRGTLHYFMGNLSFSAIEFSDIIDYQKHHYINIE